MDTNETGCESTHRVDSEGTHNGAPCPPHTDRGMETKQDPGVPEKR